MKRLSHLLSLALVVASATACQSPRETASTEKTDRDPTRWPSLSTPVPVNQQLEARIDELLSQMTLEQKVGQMIQPELRQITPEEIKQYHIGSILNGGGSFPDQDKYAPVTRWVQSADAFYHASMDDSDGGIAIPLMWGTDAVHGHTNVIGATVFPHNIGLGAARNPELMREIGRVTAREISVTGIDWNFSPTVAVARDDRWGRAYESYSEDPALVRAYAGAMVEGLQGKAGTDEFLEPGRVISTAKHFVGDGGTKEGIDRGETELSEQELIDLHAAGYVTAIEAGVQAIMASFNSWNGEELHGHEYLLNDVLKNRMNFDGLVVGDWNGHEFVPGCSTTSCPQSINAGVDILMAPDADWKTLFANTVEQVQSGDISEQRIDDAVRRILRVKLRAGLFEKGAPSSRAYTGETELLGAPEHLAVARQAVRESLVLLKNRDNLLPLSPSANILVAGNGADDIGKQSGGWTISWQGTGNANADFPHGESIFAGIEQVVANAGGRATLSEDGSYRTKPDVAIVVFGENPYAEMQGDTGHLDFRTLPSAPDQDLELLRRFQAEGIPVVSLFISGRPLWVNPELNASDAFVAIWLPGEQGGGIADVLFTDVEGNVRYDFKGKLPMSWPSHPDQSPLNVGDSDYQPLFPYGYGLRYGDTDSLADNLPEEANAQASGNEQIVRVFDNRPQAPWNLVLMDNANNVQPVTSSTAKLGPVSLQAVDREVQEDARRIQWSGTGEASVSFFSETRSDLSAFATETGALTFVYQLNRKPTAAVELGLYCGQDCGATKDISDELKDSPLDEWRSLSISMECFTQEGVKPDMVLSPFSLTTAGELDLTLYQVHFERTANVDVRCR